ncbi:uncharacterized protein PHALS_12047 [Plasmopara halstedii]|uniref:Uncharacterized protein n=1 Tax=Plasmopara halstedii TaxID=4781 RepID=A0A0P1AKD3_PLAHL|nr:uncharacterized protein PHALS_12047 [Plasmopara halstedii]CEG41716.1 hypothetical protein PHALS_12047 [Plasmopara halstedii]|eukprot:XP_024578085.1 hypothetical protein PHALS_12047 [Plasmopara halstedii]
MKNLLQLPRIWQEMQRLSCQKSGDESAQYAATDVPTRGTTRSLSSLAIYHINGCFGGLCGASEGAEIFRGGTPIVIRAVTTFPGPISLKSDSSSELYFFQSLQPCGH